MSSPRWVEDVAFALPWLWPLRLLDKLAPRYGYGRRPSPRVSKGSPEMTARIEEIMRRRKEREDKQCH